MATPRRTSPIRKASSGDPFGNLGKADWGLPFLAAVVVYALVYGVAKVAGVFLPFFPMNFILLLLAVVLGSVAGETVYALQTSGLRTSGLHRFVMCFLGAALPYFFVTLVLELVGGVGIAAALLVALVKCLGSALASSLFGMFWLGALDRVKGSIY